MEQVVHSGTGRPLRAYLSPASILRNLWSHRELVAQLARRDILGRYRAARLGLLWSVLTPLILLAIYTFVFAVVFQSKWGNDANETRGEFALTMFCGMLVFNLFSEVVNRAPLMIVSNPNYVKKVVFPLEVFVISAMLSGLFNLLIGLGVWLLGMVLVLGWPAWTVVWLPIVLVPVCLMTLGVAWTLASLGVFIRDVGHAVVLGVQVLWFITPIFYSIDRVPMPYRRALELNPLTHAVEDARAVLMRAGHPDWGWWLLSVGLSAVLAIVGYAFFMKSKRAFADVL